MSYEDQVVELLMWADPARGEVTHRATDGAKYLEALQVTSRDMSSSEHHGLVTPKSEHPKLWGWLAAAVILAVLATVGILIGTMNEESPAVTSPDFEEPVPTTPPTTAETTPPTTAETTPSTEPGAQGGVGVSGHPVFEDQPPAGEYEAVGENLRLVFTSDGEWRDCTRPYCDVHGGVEIQPSGLLSVYGWIEASRAPEELHAGFAGTPGLVVGALTPFAPSHPEATWIGVRFTVDVDPSAGRHPACEVGLNDEDFPCVEIPFLSPFFENDEIQMVPVNLYIHGPTEVMVLTTPDGSHYWAAPIWYPYPPAPEGAYEMINERFVELVRTIRFVD